MNFMGREILKNEYTIIVGCGRLGAGLANALSNEDKDVMVVDNDASSMRKLSFSYGGLSCIGDATNLDVLHEIEMEKAKVVIIVTDNDNTNIMVAQLASECLHVPEIIIRVLDPERELVYAKPNIHTICPATLLALKIQEILASK